MRNSLIATITPHITPFPTASVPLCHSHSSPAPQSLHIYTHILRPYSTRLTCRFMPPITPSTWKTARTADRFSPVCPQNVPIPPNGPEALLEVPRARLAQLRRLLPLLKNQSEDCLYLNIYVPYETQTARRKSQIALFTLIKLINLWTETKWKGSTYINESIQIYYGVVFRFLVFRFIDSFHIITYLVHRIS